MVSVNSRAFVVVLSAVVAAGALVALMVASAADGGPETGSPPVDARRDDVPGVSSDRESDPHAEPANACSPLSQTDAREVKGPPQRARIDPSRAWRDARARASSSVAWSAESFAERNASARAIQRHVPDMEFVGQRMYESGGKTRDVVVFRHLRTELEFVLVPGGTFTMGSPEAEIGRYAHETLHPVTVSPFLMARTEVTQAAWKRVFDVVPSRWKGDDLPVERVSNAQAEQYCRRVGLRLPTESEWEFACRAGTRLPWSFGDDASAADAHAWYQGNAGRRTHPVAQKLPNALGLHDIHGNVWEWCSDWHGAYPDELQIDPSGPERGADYIIRGGSWWDDPPNVRSAVRSKYRKPEQNIGFRPVLPLD